MRTESPDLRNHTPVLPRAGDLGPRAIFLLAALAFGCEAGSEAPSPMPVDEEVLSPVTEIQIRITSDTHLEQLRGLYRDREQLLAADGAAHADGWGMSLDEAMEHVNEGIRFHIEGVYFLLAAEEDGLRTRASLADVIADHAAVAAEEVLKDIGGIDEDIRFPEKEAVR